MKKILFIIVLIFCITGLNSQSTQSILYEDFEYDGTGENPDDHCDELGSFLNDGFYGNWSIYNMYPVYTNLDCLPTDNYPDRGGVFMQNWSGAYYDYWPYQAIGNNSIGIASSGFNHSSAPYNELGWGVTYFDPDVSNPNRLYFGPGQEYLVKYRAKMPRGDYDYYNMAVGFRKSGQEMQGSVNYELPPPIFTYYYNPSDDYDGIVEFVDDHSQWNSYTAKIRNLEIERAYQLIIAFDELTYWDGVFRTLEQRDVLGKIKAISALVILLVKIQVFQFGRAKVLIFQPIVLLAV